MRDNWLRKSTDSSLYSSILMLKWNLLSLKIPSIIYFLLHLFLGIQREIIFFIIFEITLYWETYLKIPFISKIAVWMNSIVKFVNHIQTWHGFFPPFIPSFCMKFCNLDMSLSSFLLLALCSKFSSQIKRLTSLISDSR